MAIFNIFIFMIISVMLMYITIYLVDILMIFIKYQKLNNIATKYSYIIQEYGRLTSKEEESLYNDLKNEQFDLSSLTVNMPEESKTYGELVSFAIECKTYLDINLFNERKQKSNTINLKVNKSFYIKK